MAARGAIAERSREGTSGEGGARSGPSPSIAAVVVSAPVQERRPLLAQQLARIAEGPSVARLASSLRRSHPRRSDDEIEDAIQHAFERSYARCDSESERKVYSWLWRTADRRLCDRGRELAREVPAAADSNVWLRAVEERGPQETLEEADEERNLVALFQQLAGELPPRQRSVLALHARGRERRALAEDLGVSERIVKRSLEHIHARARELVSDRCGSGCEQGTQGVCRLAFGLAAGSEARRAQLHLMSCPTCQAFHERLAWWREAAAGVVPVPVTHELDPTLAERTLGRLADAALGVKQQLFDTGSSIRQHASDGAASVKTQAAATYYRGSDPTPLAAVRPGPVAAVIVSCLTVAGGGAYCVDQGIDPIRVLAGAGGQEEQRPAPPPQDEPALAAPEQGLPPAATPPPAVQPAPAPAPPAPPPTPPPASPVPEPAAPPPPAPPDEFDPASSAAAGIPQPTSGASSSPAPEPAPVGPAPAPSGGGGEFGGP